MIGSKKDLKNSSAADLWRDSEGRDLATPKAFDADVPPSHDARENGLPTRLYDGKYLNAGFAGRLHDPRVIFCRRWPQPHVWR